MMVGDGYLTTIHGHHLYVINIKSPGSFFITSLAKEVMFLVALVLSACLSVCGQHYSKSYEWIGEKFYGEVLGSTMKN